MSSVAVDSTVSQPSVESLPVSVEVLSVRRLMWLRFKRNRLALFGGGFLILMYLTALFAGFLAPYGVRTTHDEYASAPPHGIRFMDAQGRFHLRPFVYGLKVSVNPQTFRREYTPLTDQLYPVSFFVRGVPYKLFGLIETDRHLFGVEEPGKIFLLGTDRQGRDLFSRILYGSQVSLTVGLVGVFLSLIIGTVLGVATGYFGGLFDNIIQRVIEVLLAFPQIPFWLALAALVPPTWSSVQVFFGISIVLSLVNWGSLARQVRGMVYSLREEDYVMAARYTNCSHWRIITRHLLPNTLSHVLVIATLAIPNMILGETALSFLGLGIRPPMTSWGLLLNEAQHVRVLLQQPWLLTPALFVVATIISFNFLGDGLRDAADPFTG
ncbi:MAG: peptide ABC transporter permease [Pirellulaceae bacterium]|nr:MAG: peptide ABC transporter permease [Pirellulaceae bacterium]